MAGSFPAVALADVLRVIVPTGEETLTSAAGEYLSAGMGLVTADGDGMLLTSAAVGLITAGGGEWLFASRESRVWSASCESDVRVASLKRESRVWNASRESEMRVASLKRESRVWNASRESETRVASLKNDFAYKYLIEMSKLFNYDIFIWWFEHNMLGIIVTFTIFDSRNYQLPFLKLSPPRPIYLIGMDYFDFFGSRCQVSSFFVSADWWKYW